MMATMTVETKAVEMASSSAVEMGVLSADLTAELTVGTKVAYSVHRRELRKEPSTVETTAYWSASKRAAAMAVPWAEH